MGNRRGQVDMSHTLTAHLGQGHFNATLFTDYTTVLEALVLAAQALVILDRAKNFGTKKTITLWLERAVVDCLRLFYFAKRP